MMRQKKDGLNTKIYVIKELRNSIGKAPTQWVKSLFGAKNMIFICVSKYLFLDTDLILGFFFVKLPR
jgi:hypothetical protein